jgi:tRNA(His) 5'-end guanylyltransferase
VAAVVNGTRLALSPMGGARAPSCSALTPVSVDGAQAPHVRASMGKQDLEQRMRSLEYFHAVRALPGTWTILRVDGRGFSRLTATRFAKPFDRRFCDLMVTTAQALFAELHGIYAYTESDEISVLFHPRWDFFDRKVEKLVSVSAGIASATFTHALGETAHFDSRIWLGVDSSLVVDYFLWRQSDAVMCALNGWSYWIVRRSGKSAKDATEMLHNKSVRFKNELLFQHGVNFNNLPAWQRRGIGLYLEVYEKDGYNPIAHTKVVTMRRRTKIDADLPIRDEYRNLLNKILKPWTQGAPG